MANTLRIKRRTTGASGAPSSLANAELAFNEVNNTLYYGKGDSEGAATSIIAIGGDGTFATKSYVDSAVSGAAPTGVAYLAQDNTWDATKTNTFNGTVNLEGTFKIDNVTVSTSAAELNLLDNAQANTVVNSKAVIYGSAGQIAAATLDTTGNVTVGGNLTVNGTTTTVNSTVVTIDDPIFTLGGDVAAAADDNKDRGIAFQWHTGSAARIGFFGYDDSAAAFTFIPDATISSEVVSGTAGDLIVGKVNNVTFTSPASAATLTLGSGKTVSISNTLTFTGTDSSSVAFGAGGTVTYTSNTLAVFAATTSSQLAGVISDETGTGALVFANTPTLVTPVLGTPTSGTLTNCTGLPVATGISGLATGVATFLATPSSANLASAVTDETGSGALVFANTPTLVTPNIGVATATTVNKVTLTAPATGSTLTIADSKTLTVSNTLTFTGTDASSVAFGAGGTVAYTGNKLSVFAATSSSELAGVISDETGTGALVFANTPTLVTPVLGTPTSGTLTNCTGLPVSTGISGLATGVATFLATPSSANLASAVTDETGTGALVFANTPTLVTPVLGTPTSGTLTNCTGLPVSTGISGLATGVATFLATPSSANLASAVTDETGSGALVFGTGPTITTSILSGSATLAVFNTTATTVNAFGAATTLSMGAGSGTTTINNNLTVTGNLTINGTTTTVNSTVVTIDDPIFTLGGDTAPGSDDNKDRGIEFRWYSGSAKVGFFGFDDSTGKFTFIPDATNTSEVFSGTLGTIDVGAVHINGSQIAASNLSNGTTGSGTIVLATSPTLVTPALGTPSSGTLTSCTGLPVSTGISGLGAGVATFLATPSSANLISAVSDETGTGALVFANTPTLVTPVLGTPTSGTLTNCTGLPVSTGVSGLGTNVATFLATPSSANLAAALTDETGSGKVVFDTSPTLVTPTLGVASATSINKVAITAPATSATLTIANGKTLTVSNTLTFTGTDSSSVAFGAGGTVVYADTVCSAIANCTLDGGTF